MDRRGYEIGNRLRLPEESRRFGEMAMTDVSKQLIFLFFATNELKKDPGVDPAQYPDCRSPLRAAAVDKIAIYWRWFMGAGIGSIAVQHGTRPAEGRGPRSRLRRGTRRCGTSSRKD